MTDDGRDSVKDCFTLHVWPMMGSVLLLDVRVIASSLVSRPGVLGGGVYGTPTRSLGDAAARPRGARGAGFIFIVQLIGPSFVTKLAEPEEASSERGEWSSGCAARSAQPGVPPDE